MLNEYLMDTLEGGGRSVLERLGFPLFFPTKLRHLKYHQLANSGAQGGTKREDHKIKRADFYPLFGLVI